MKLKLDANGNAVLIDGKPVYIYDDGTEAAVDVATTVATISRLNAEAKTHREGKEAAEKALKKFEGIDDPSAAIKALNTVKNLDDKKLVDAGDVEKVKQEVAKVYEEKLTAETTRATQLESQLHTEVIGGAFARSAFLTGKVAIPTDLVQAKFGQQFKLENGKMVAYDSNGQAIFSKKNPGSHADFEEAIETIVTSYAHKDTILKSSGQSGSGSQSSNGNPKNKDLSNLSPTERMTQARAAAGR